MALASRHIWNALIDAANACRLVQGEWVTGAALEKGDKSPVTVADFASQAILCKHIGDAFPDDPIVAEENSEMLRDRAHAGVLDQVAECVGRVLETTVSAPEVLDWIDRGAGQAAPRFWTMDPLDGTKGFLRGGQYAVALALLEDQEVTLGGLACPSLPLDLDRAHSPCGTLFLARRGKGAMMVDLSEQAEMASIGVKPSQTLGTARLVESVETAHKNAGAQARVAKRLGISEPPLHMDSQAKYAAVARGDASIYLRLPNPKTPDYRERIWDHAAGALLVEEAGGSVTDCTGQPLDWGAGARLERNRGVVATCGTIHAAVIEATGRT